MTIALDVSNDFFLCDFLDSATLRVDGQADVALTQCVLSNPTSWREMDPTGGQVIRSGQRFAWPVSRSSRPPIGAVIVDATGAYWTIWRLIHKQHVATYEATCLNLSIVTAVENEATILVANYSKGRANEAKSDWVGAVSGQATPTAADKVPARFQPSEESARLFLGAEYTKTTYRVYFDQPAPLQAAGADCRLVDKDGFRYRVVRYTDEQRLDRLPVALAVRIVEGTEFWDK